MTFGKYIAFALGILVWSCNSKSDAPAEPHLRPSVVKNKLQKANTMLVRNEAYEIEHYIARRKWEMQETGSGLRYMILKEGEGDTIRHGQRVTYAYTITLLNGNVCYDSEKDGLKTFAVGSDQIESGVLEMVQLINKGTKVKMILPSHLAFGLVGDDNKIPSRATLVYDLEIVEVK
ncbi:MAG: FKBP-type peptidyl-prolyl cis-trans isomerase [Flavobacteriales bacterium]|nr:FKBP-type peptidyl-prolyl cis-trans isomerase [Flavobacteriales bacterium]